ncbi:MAG TPA: SAM-dependent methyltransferase [Streptosporangiaceae bacterium]|nr:SAM-dependent methyltransferase [Streptosporangiaceae bacterium]
MEPPKIDTTRAHAARMYDYYLGGKDHFAVDRETAQRAVGIWPTVRTAVRENRAFLGRAVRYLVREEGIRQFLDIGTGLPSANNVHEVAQAAAPECRIVYVDNDPIVLTHARALLTSSPGGKTAYIQADLRQPEKILVDPATRETVDFSRPVALMLVAILHFLTDEDDPAGVVATLVDALPSGSYLVASHGTPEYDPETARAFERVYAEAGVSIRARTADEFAEVAFSGLELVDPGITLVSEWRPEGPGPRPLPNEVNWNCGVARKS